MLSLVLIGVTGAMGGENIRILIDGEVKREAELGAFYDSLGVTADGPVELSDIRVEFTNDLYEPEKGIDRNVIIHSVAIDFVEQEIKPAETFSTGTWLAEDGVSPGFGRGTTLHANGYIQFGVEAATSIEFQANEWTVNRPFESNEAFVDPANGDLVISGVNGPIALSREIPFEAGVDNTFTVEAYREVLQGSFASDNAPWATAGINFYDIDGNLVTQETIEINSEYTEPGSVQDTISLSSPGITSAFMWVWIDGFEKGTDIPLRLQNISFEPLDLAGDTSPPQAFFQFTEILSSPGEEINFLVTFEDDQLLEPAGNGVAPNAIRVTSNDGFEGTAVQRTGTSDSSDIRQGIIYGLLKPDGSDWTEADNGVYSLYLEENSLVDAAGNVAPAKRFTNQLFVDITPGEPDTEPATITLQPVDTVTSLENGGVQFVVNTTDNTSPAPYSDELRITSDNGFDQTIRGTAGGFDTELNQTWQLYVIRSAISNGTYTISLPAGELIDRAGNETPSQVLGTFVVDLDEPIAV